jgi:hypothetical protein
MMPSPIDFMPSTAIARAADRNDLLLEAAGSAIVERHLDGVEVSRAGGRPEHPQVHRRSCGP